MVTNNAITEDIMKSTWNDAFPIQCQGIQTAIHRVEAPKPTSHIHPEEVMTSSTIAPNITPYVNTATSIRKVYVVV